MRNRIHMRAVERAAEIAGSRAQLARYLGVQPTLVEAWIEGALDVPGLAFLKVVEIVVDREGEHLCGAIPRCEADTFKYREAANS